MKQEFKDYLFQHHILVYDLPYVSRGKIHFDSLIALANKFGIRITSGAELANVQMIKDAERCLGIYVPEPFYRGFPDTVREMTPDQLYYDQIYHYTQTYGLGWFENPGHSVLENYTPENEILLEFDSKMIPEHVEPKDFIILSEADALKELFVLLDGLCQSSRPLNVGQMDLIIEAFNEYGGEFIKKGIACKKTAVELLYTTRNMAFTKGLRLNDTIKLLEVIQNRTYDSSKLNKLNLKNQDRKFITKVIHTLSSKSTNWFEDIVYCYTKRKIWCGLLHHIHFKAENGNERTFVKSMRSGKNNSIESYFEKYMTDGDFGAAAKYLSNEKGNGALFRNLNYILSRCNNTREVSEVLECLE